jgi:hypothetical protein
VAARAAGSDDQLWTTTQFNLKLPNDWRLSEELTQRFSDDRKGLYEVESNTLVGHVVAKNVVLWAGYTHDPQYKAGHFTIMERRAREQVTVDNFAVLGRGQLSGRMRLEQRWRHEINGTGWRLRPFLKYSLPIARKLRLNLSCEPFINLNSTVFQKKPGLERFRNLITFSLPLFKHVSAEWGYENQYTIVRRSEDQDDHIAYLALSISV